MPGWVSRDQGLQKQKGASRPVPPPPRSFLGAGWGLGVQAAAVPSQARGKGELTLWPVQKQAGRRIIKMPEVRR